MTKNEFIREIKLKTKHLTKFERKEIISYYNEMITERMEDGMSEQAAVAAIGSVDELLASYSPMKPVAKTARYPRLRPWHIVLMVIGAPLWIPLLVAFLALVLALYIVIWAIVVCCYAVFVSLMASGLICFAASIVSIFSGVPAYAFACAGAGFVLAGLALMWLVPCNFLAKAMAKLSGKIGKGVFRIFFRR